jgi:hypothetical protein
MAVQTTYVLDKGIGFAGQILNAEFAQKISRIAAGAIPFGRGVSRRASPADTPEQVGLPAATGDVSATFRGVSLRDESRKANTGYEVNDPVGIGRKGVFVVEVDEVVLDGEAAFCRHASGAGGTTLGRFRNDADTATATAVPTGVFRGVTIAGPDGVLLMGLELNLP